MFALALRSGYGENTRVHGVGDGAPWIAQQMAAVFPRQRRPWNQAEVSSVWSR